MNTEFLLVTLLVGVGTWLLRYLPTRFMRGTGDANAPFSRFLAATGPAAIAALFVGGVIPMLSLQFAEIAPLVIGTLAVVGLYLWRRDVTLATLGGAIAYGVVFALI